MKRNEGGLFVGVEDEGKRYVEGGGRKIVIVFDSQSVDFIDITAFLIKHNKKEKNDMAVDGQ